MTTAISTPEEEYEFDFTGGIANTAETPVIATTAIRMATDPQKLFYLDLCARKKMTPIDVVSVTFDALDADIKRVKSFFPANENQIKLIQAKITILQSAKVEIQQLSPEVIATLTGGKDGTASKLIGQLMKMEEEQKENIPPDARQLKEMINWFLCVYVPFEDYGIQRKVDLEDGKWRYKTANEFAHEIKTHMCHSEASRFMTEYGKEYMKWSTTRISTAQKAHIKRLEERMSELKSTTVVEWAVGLDGQLKQVERKVMDSGAKLAMTAHIPLNDYQIQMFSYDEAKKYITLLEKEKDNKVDRTYAEFADNSLTFEEVRKLSTLKDVNDDEFERLKDLIFKLEAIAGYNNDEAQDSVSSLLAIDGASENLEGCRDKIRSFMEFLVTHGYIDFISLAEMMSYCPTAVRILIGR